MTALGFTDDSDFDDFDAWSMDPGTSVRTPAVEIEPESQHGTGGGSRRASVNDEPTDKQLAFLRSLAKQLGSDDPDTYVEALRAAAGDKWSKRFVSQAIDTAKRGVAELAAQSAVTAPSAAPARTNRYAGRCGKCGQHVEAEAGTCSKLDGRWVVEHTSCTAPVAETAVPTITGGTIPEGTYTVVHPDGSYRTIRVAAAAWSDGKLVASYLSGSDNTLDYTGFAFVTETGATVWRKFADNDALAADLSVLLDGGVRDEAHGRFLDHAESYALASGSCMRCLRTLTVPASLHRGLGPKCATIEGV